MLVAKIAQFLLEDGNGLQEACLEKLCNFLGELVVGYGSLLEKTA